VRASEVFGDTERAKDVLTRLLALLDDFTDAPPTDETPDKQPPHDPTPSSTKRRRPTR
jgi:hypothetical protein